MRRRFIFCFFAAIIWLLRLNYHWYNWGKNLSFPFLPELYDCLISIIIYVPRRFNPTYRSNQKRSDPHRISSESDIFNEKPIGSDRFVVRFLSVGIRLGFPRNSTKPDEIWPDPTRISSASDEFQRNPSRNPTERNPTTTLSDPIDIIKIRQDPTPHESPG